MHADHSRQTIDAAADPVTERGPMGLPLISSLNVLPTGRRPLVAEHYALGSGR